MTTCKRCGTETECTTMSTFNRDAALRFRAQRQLSAARLMTDNVLSKIPGEIIG